MFYTTLAPYQNHKGTPPPLTKLRSPLPIDRHVCPVIRPVDLLRLPQREDGLDGERHAGLAHAHRLVLRVVRDPRRRVELGVDAVAAPRGHDAAAPRLGVLLDDAAEVPDRGAGLDELDCLVEAFTRGLDHPDRVRIRLGAVTDVVRLVEVGMVAPMVYGDIEVDYVSVQEDTLVRYPMTNNLVRGCTEGLGEVAIVQGGRVGL